MLDYVSALPSYYCDMEMSINVPIWDSLSHSYWCWAQTGLGLQFQLVTLKFTITNSLLYFSCSVVFWYTIQMNFKLVNKIKLTHRTGLLHKLPNIFLLKGAQRIFRLENNNFSTQTAVYYENKTYSFYERNEDALRLWQFNMLPANFAEHTIEKSALPSNELEIYWS